MLLAWLSLLVVGIGALPPIERDEARFIEATRGMYASAESTGWIVPRVGDEPRLNKPPLVYWLQSASMALADRFGWVQATGMPAVWPYRLVSINAVLLSGFVVCWFARQMFAAPVAGWAVWIFFATQVLVVDARLARADQLLLTCILVAQAALWRLWLRDGRGSGVWQARAVLWIAIGFGVMTKGPVAPLVVGLTALALAAIEWRWTWLWRLRPDVGVLISLAPLAMWVALVVQQVGFETWWQKAVVEELWQRGTESMERPMFWPGTYTLLSSGLLWPGSLVLYPALVRGWRAARTHWHGARHRGHPPRAGRAELFCFAWLVPGWILFELLPTKLPHYILPLAPAFALLAARGLFARRLWSAVYQSWLGRAALLGWVLLGALLTGGISFAALVFLRDGASRTTEVLAIIHVTLALLLIGGMAAALVIQRHRAALATSFALATVSHALLFGWILPGNDQLWLSRSLAKELWQLDPQQERPVVSAIWDEESLWFLTRGHARSINLRDLESFMRDNPNTLAIAPDSEHIIRDDVERLFTVEGLRYANFRAMRLVLFQGREAVSDAGVSSAGVAVDREASIGNQRRNP